MEAPSGVTQIRLKAALRRALWALALLAALYAIKPAPLAPADHVPNRPLRVALFVNGTLGDKSFYDSAARGLKQAQADLGLRTRVIEAGMDPTRWEAALTDVADSGDFDIIVTGGFAMVNMVQRLSPQFLRTHFIVFDAATDPAKCRCENVHSLLFRQNEGAYIAGYLAGRSTALDATLGVVGAMQIPVIDDFIVGFTAGAQRARPGVRVLRQYVNSFTDPATGKEIAKAMYGQGAALLFHAAAGSGQGVIEAAAEAGRPAIGVDSDQYALYLASNPGRARTILSSVLKNVDTAVFRALEQARAGTLAYGSAQSLGLAEGGVSLATGSELMRRLPEALLKDVATIQAEVVSGRLVVPSAFAATAISASNSKAPS